ncbi:biogenesis of lysosome-related organelles complex 1 subunit 5 isoform X2 [Leucoraja erinacea]|uniref:biogenesis of lysosome-related organelles complex 1 subunit 5 isoform X2 n=1 Tax=Leucoraja erinaceus TaxID=7782 RepID=UPI0024547DD9|nr:biogenesis of lysosome-related organelles complex 1 subunit 5 isoform X2 [Leucoraja erinacea]
MERARRDLSEVYSRLFDHRPVVQAEIRYFVKEFEEKRGFREERGLENVDSTIKEFITQSFPDVCEDLGSSIPTVLPRLEAAIQITNRIQQKEQEADQVQKKSLLATSCQHKFGNINMCLNACCTLCCLQSDRLQASRERRKAEWEAFVKEQHRKAAEVEADHTKAAEWLKQQYAAMEKDLAKFTTI